MSTKVKLKKQGLSLIRNVLVFNVTVFGLEKKTKFNTFSLE